MNLEDIMSVLRDEWAERVEPAGPVPAVPVHALEEEVVRWIEGKPP